MKIALLSDTHGLLRPEVLAALKRSDHILHAGDVGVDAILATLRTIAPLTAIRGNVDHTGLCARLPPTEAVELGGKLFYLIHSVHDLDIDPIAARVDVVLSGHSHKPLIEQRGPVLYLNPGSAGPRRFKLPITMAFVDTTSRTLNPTLITLVD